MISPETARTLTRMMTQVVARGTGHNAAIPGYDVAGKTGTAQKLDPVTRRYSRSPGVLSFVGFVPADEPRLVMLVMLDEPKNEKWGSEAAAPIFAAIGGGVLRYLERAPARRDARCRSCAAAGSERRHRRPAGGRSARTSWSRAATRRVMPELRGRTLRHAMATLAPLGVGVKMDGRGSSWRRRPRPASRCRPERRAADPGARRREMTCRGMTCR